jgi:hypothetical protein
MKTEIMAQYLMSGDIVTHDRKKAYIRSANTADDTTTLFYTRPGDTVVHYMCNMPKSQFVTVINDGRF